MDTKGSPETLLHLQRRQFCPGLSKGSAYEGDIDFVLAYGSLVWTAFRKERNEEKTGKENQIPEHKNVIRNFVNIEIFHKDDLNHEDCVGWITIMEKAGKDLRALLKYENTDIQKRKKIAGEILDGFNYLFDIGILQSYGPFQTDLM